jgi:DNA-binding response OmpR family regulator
MNDGVRVLVVEDEASLRDALAKYLDRRGFKTATASSGN